MKSPPDMAPSNDAPSAPAPYGAVPYGLGFSDDGRMARLLAPRRLLRVALRKGWMIALGAALGISAAWFYLSLRRRSEITFTSNSDGRMVLACKHKTGVFTKS